MLFVGLATLRASAMAPDPPLAARGASLFAGIVVPDLATGQVPGTLRLAPEVEELFDFVVLPGIRIFLSPIPVYP